MSWIYSIKCILIYIIVVFYMYLFDLVSVFFRIYISLFDLDVFHLFVFYLFCINILIYALYLLS